MGAPRPGIGRTAFLLRDGDAQRRRRAKTCNARTALPTAGSPGVRRGWWCSWRRAGRAGAGRRVLLWRSRAVRYRVAVDRGVLIGHRSEDVTRGWLGDAAAYGLDRCLDAVVKVEFGEDAGDVVV